MTLCKANFVDNSIKNKSLKESNNLGNEYFQSPFKFCMQLGTLHSCCHGNNDCLFKAWGLIFIQKRRKKRVNCLFLYLKLNTTLKIGTSTVNSNIIWFHIYSFNFPGSECEHTNRLFISVRFRSFLLSGKTGKTFI